MTNKIVYFILIIIYRTNSTNKVQMLIVFVTIFSRNLQKYHKSKAEKLNLLI